MPRSLPSSRLRSASVLGIAAATVLAGASAAHAQEGRIKLFGHGRSLIAGASWFTPSDATTRSIYGSGFGPALGLWSFDTHAGLGVSFDLGAHRLTQDTRRAESIQAGLGPRWQFTDASAAVAPYLTVRGDAYVVRLDRTDWRTKPGANVELGASVLRHVVLSGRYDFVPKIDGVDVSGFSARAALKIF